MACMPEGSLRSCLKCVTDDYGLIGKRPVEALLANAGRGLGKGFSIRPSTERLLEQPERLLKEMFGVYVARFVVANAAEGDEGHRRVGVLASECTRADGKYTLDILLGETILCLRHGEKRQACQGGCDIGMVRPERLFTHGQKRA